MNYLKIIYSVCVGVMLVGCDSRVGAVEQEMAKIRSEPPLAIEPAPTFMPAPNYEYDAYRLKSPFLANQHFLPQSYQTVRPKFPHLLQQ